MAASANTHTSTLNVALAGADLDENFQNMFLLMHQFLKDMGSVVLASSDGVTADLTDNVSVIADVVSAAGSVAHTWVVYQMTTGWFLLVECNDALATPRSCDHFGADGGGYDLTGLVVTDPPAAITPANQWNRININHIPTAVPATPMTVHSSVASNGQGWFCVSEDGTADGEFGLMHLVFPTPDSPNFPYAYFVDDLVAFAITDLVTASNWRGHHVNGVDYANVTVTSPASLMNVRTSGVADTTSEPVKSPAMFHSNNTSVTRDFGTAVDIKFGASQMPSNIVEDADPDPQRFVTINNAWLMVESAALPGGPSPLDL